MAKLLVRVRKKGHSAARWLRDLGEHLRVALGPKSRLARTHSRAPLIVSLTSFPARIGGAWLAIESIFQQTLLPDKIVLVLSIEEFPHKEIPWTLKRQVARGLEIMWVYKNGRSFDKLIPTRIVFPSASILTVDDDKLLPKNLIAELMAVHLNQPDTIIGARGWDMKSSGGTMEYGVGWTRANADTPSRRLFLPGNAGVLYPAGSLDDRLNDMQGALALTPTNDDIWFWGIATARQTTMKCLGKAVYPTIFFQKNSPALGDVNTVNNGPQFQAILDHFSIRDHVIAACDPGWQD